MWKSLQCFLKQSLPWNLGWQKTCSWSQSLHCHAGFFLHQPLQYFCSLDCPLFSFPDGDSGIGWSFLFGVTPVQCCKIILLFFSFFCFKICLGKNNASLMGSQHANAYKKIVEIVECCTHLHGPFCMLLKETTFTSCWQTRKIYICLHSYMVFVLLLIFCFV